MQDLQSRACRDYLVPMKPSSLFTLLFGSMATAALATESVPVTTASTAPADTAALAEKLQNPVADLISVQFQNNFNFTAVPQSHFSCRKWLGFRLGFG